MSLDECREHEPTRNMGCEQEMRVRIYYLFFQYKLHCLVNVVICYFQALMNVYQFRIQIWMYDDERGAHLHSAYDQDHSESVQGRRLNRLSYGGGDHYSSVFPTNRRPSAILPPPAHPLATPSEESFFDDDIAEFSDSSSDASVHVLLPCEVDGNHSSDDSFAGMMQGPVLLSTRQRTILAEPFGGRPPPLHMPVKSSPSVAPQFHLSGHLAGSHGRPEMVPPVLPPVPPIVLPVRMPVKSSPSVVPQFNLSGQLRVARLGPAPLGGRPRPKHAPPHQVPPVPPIQPPLPPIVFAEPPLPLILPPVPAPIAPVDYTREIPLPRDEVSVPPEIPPEGKGPLKASRPAKPDHLDKQYPFKCPYCDIRCASRGDIVLHINRIHNPHYEVPHRKTAECQVSNCFYRAERPAQAKYHCVHHGSDESPVPEDSLEYYEMCCRTEPPGVKSQRLIAKADELQEPEEEQQRAVENRNMKRRLGKLSLHCISFQVRYINY